MSLYDSVRLSECEGVYQPAEDSELLAKAVEQYAFGYALDMGTGTGIQGIVAAKSGCGVVFCDIDPAALRCAAGNAASNRVFGEFVQSDLFGSVRRRFNTIIFNPPYVPTGRGERGMPVYLAGGEGGREVIARFLSGLRPHLLDDHVVLMVESSLNSYERDVAALGAEVVGKVHMSFEDIVVLKF